MKGGSSPAINFFSASGSPPPPTSLWSKGFISGRWGRGGGSQQPFWLPEGRYQRPCWGWHPQKAPWPGHGSAREQLNLQFTREPAADTLQMYTYCLSHLYFNWCAVYLVPSPNHGQFRKIQWGGERVSASNRPQPRGLFDCRRLEPPRCRQQGPAPEPLLSRPLA